MKVEIKYRRTLTDQEIADILTAVNPASDDRVDIEEAVEEYIATHPIAYTATPGRFYEVAAEVLQPSASR